MCLIGFGAPSFHNKNLLTVLNGPEIDLASRHAKVRRDGYRRSS